MWIGIDLGTSACKVVAVDGEGRVVAQAAQPYPLHVPQPGWSEQDPADWWAAADACVRRVVHALGGGDGVRGIGLCGQMHGLVALDAEDRVLRPAVLWNDQRSAAECEEVTAAAGGLDALLDLVGNRMLPGFTVSKVLWMRRHEPELFARTAHVLNPKDHLRLLLTGDHATDVSDASGTGLFDVRHRRWSGELLRLLDLSPALLPTVVESTDVTGCLLPEVAAAWGLPAGTPVVGGGGDSVLQTTSMGVLDPDVHGIVLGTAGLLGAAETRCPDNPGGRFQVSCGNEAGRWHVMGVSLNAGGTFAWLRQALSGLTDGAELDFDRLSELAGSVPPGSEDLLFLPYLSGERCPHVAPDARGSWFGLTGRHGAGHLVRSVMEGVVLNLAEVRSVLAEAGVTASRLRVSGGGARHDVWLRLLADVLDEEVATVVGAEHGGAFGAALLAGVGTGRWAGLGEALQVVTEERTTRPDPAVRATYDRLSTVFRMLHPALAPVAAALAATPAPPVPAPPVPAPPVPAPPVPAPPPPAGGPVRAVVLDLDGTLADTAADIARNVSTVLAGHGIAPCGAALVEEHTGRGARDLLAGVYAALGLSTTPQRFDEDLTAYLAASREVPVRDAVLFADAAQALADLAQAGVAIGVCTNKGEAIAWEVLRHLGIAPLVGAVVGGDTLAVRKPHPAHLLETVARLGADAASALYVGDTPIDVETGRAAGVRTWVVDWSTSVGPDDHPATVRRMTRFAELVAEVAHRAGDAAPHPLHPTPSPLGGPR